MTREYDSFIGAATVMVTATAELAFLAYSSSIYFQDRSSVQSV